MPKAKIGRSVLKKRKLKATKERKPKNLWDKASTFTRFVILVDNGIVEEAAEILVKMPEKEVRKHLSSEVWDVIKEDLASDLYA